MTNSKSEANAPAKHKMTTWEKNQLFWGWLFIIPTMAGLIILNLYPIVNTIYQSMCKTGDFGRGNVFVGFDNFNRMFGDAEVWQALLNTIKYAIIEVPFLFVLLLFLRFF